MSSRVAADALCIVQREHAGYLASYEKDAWNRLLLAFNLVSATQDEVERLWKVDPRAAVATVAPLRSSTVSQIKAIATEFASPDQTDRAAFEGIFDAYCQRRLVSGPAY